MLSYDLEICVKIEGLDQYAMIAEPEFAHPTYNLGPMFRACMDWDYSQCERDENNDYHTCYYKCSEIITKVERGIRELRLNRNAYEQYIPDNGYGTLDGAIRALESLRSCIYEQAENIPIDHLYMCW